MNSSAAASGLTTPVQRTERIAGNEFKALAAADRERWAASRKGRTVIGVARRSFLSERFAFC